MKTVINMLVVAVLLLIAGCCKRKEDNLCINNQISVNPFYQRYGNFWCLGNTEYTYVMRSKAQIDSLSNCNYTHPIPFPVDEKDFVYIMVGKMAFYYRDTFQTTLLKDTCYKRLTYQVDMIQQYKTLNTFPGVVSMFCAVENIPPDYQVEVKYKYVPIE